MFTNDTRMNIVQSDIQNENAFQYLLISNDSFITSEIP